MSEEKKYDHVMRFNVTYDEYKKIVDLAKNYGMSISDVCRYALSNEISSFKWADKDYIEVND